MIKSIKILRNISKKSNQEITKKLPRNTFETWNRT